MYLLLGDKKYYSHRMTARRYSREEFEAFFPGEDTCLRIIFEQRYGNWNICPVCYKRSKFHKVTNRKCFSCQRCGFQVYPLAKTIYNKSSTSLKKWFYAIYLFSHENGISAKELQRQISVTYKTAWRILREIKKLHEEPDDVLSGVVEIDEKYINDFISKLRNNS